jgi:hypothetical protein
MKAVKITLVLLTTAAILHFLKSEEHIDIRRSLPFLDGEPPNTYHVAALAIILIFLWGLSRLGRGDDNE